MYSGGGLRRVETRAGVFDASTETVSPSYFDIVGARAAAGRFFTDSDDAVVVISETFRRRIFGDGPSVGETIKMDTVPATVIGVATNGFDGLRFDHSTDIIVPFALPRAEVLARWPSIQWATLPAALPESERQALFRQRVDVAPLASGFSGLRERYGARLGMLLGMMGILLAVACARIVHSPWGDCSCKIAQDERSELPVRSSHRVIVDCAQRTRDESATVHDAACPVTHSQAHRRRALTPVW